MRSITLLVLNYNGASITVAGKPLLDIALPTVIAACENYAGQAEIVVVDNQSQDNSCAHMARQYPSIRVHKARSNDFLFSYNEAIEFIDTDLVMLLNNDMCLAEDALAPLTETFDDDSVFAVGADVFLKKNGETSDIPDSRCMRMQWYKGRVFPVDISGVIEHGLPRPLYALGGAVAFDTEKFRQLGGLDRIFYPYNFEDSDIAFRAYCKGWKTCIQEQARAYHLGSKTIGTLIERNTAHNVFLANEYTFIWKNVRSKTLLFISILWVPWHMARHRFGGAVAYMQAFVTALAKIRTIRTRRTEQFSNDIPVTDSLFFNNDLKGMVRELLWAKVYCAANEPLKALSIVRRLFERIGSGSDYVKKALQAIVTDCLVVLFQDKRYKTIIKCERMMSAEMLNSHSLYTVASSLRMMGETDRAVQLYYRVAENSQADTRIRGSAFYHCASIMGDQNKRAKTQELGTRCLALMPEHEKCKKLLETIG